MNSAYGLSTNNNLIGKYSGYTDSLSFQLSKNREYVWENLVVARKSAKSLVHRLYEDSIFHDFVMLFTAKVL
jgi:hypothetical protein